jgi:hypothetical protein
MRNTKSTNRWGKWLCAALAAGAIASAALPASADERRDYDRGRDRRDGGVRVGVDLNLGGGRREPRVEERRVKVWVEPVYRTVTERVWVEPTFRMVSERVWQEPVVRVQTERFSVPDRYEWRSYYRQDRFGRRVHVREKVLVERAHFEERQTRVVVKPGCWETVERREVDREGYFNNVTRREVVAPGHFEWRTERVAVERGRRDTVVGLDWDLD